MSIGKSERKGQAMTFKTTRILKELASDAGLVFLGLRSKSRHNWASFRNKDGVVLLHPMSKSDEISGRDVLNMRGQFRRFARGQVHGLKVIKS
jgi:hypothetical protein